MVRKMAYIGSSYLIGLFFASFFVYDINFCLSAAIVVTAVVSAFLFRSKSVKIAVCLLSAAAAILIYSLYDMTVYQNIIKYDGCDVEIKGIDFLRLVLTLPSKSFRPGDRLAKAKETLEEVLINLIQYQIKSILYSCFRSFYPMSSLCSRILPRNHVTFGCHVSLGFSRL